MKNICLPDDSLKYARSLLLDPYELNESHIVKAIEEVLARGVHYSDLYLQYSQSEGWSLEEGIVKSGSFSINHGVGIRAISGEKTAFSYSSSLSPEILQSLSRTVCAGLLQGKNEVGMAGPALGEQTNSLYTIANPLFSLSASEKILLLKRVEHIAKAADPRVTQVMASLGIEHDVVLIAKNSGQMVADVRPLTRLSLTVIVSQNGRREIGSSGGGGRFGPVHFTEEVILDYVKQAVHEAITNLDARPAPAGEMTVVLGPGWPGVLLHEAVGHGLESDFNRKGSSVFSGRVGQRVASKGVTVVDNGTLKNRRGSLNIDDEGNKTQCTVLIEDGILLGYMQDSLNACLMGNRPTGNGRRESFAHLPMPRMTNTYMLAGKTPAGEIIESVNHGLYAVNFSGGQVDITNGKFVFSTSEAYMVENGKITYPVKNATLIGNGPEAMNNVTLIGDNLRFDSGIGTCGKNGQSVPVGVGMPTVRIEGLTVGGTE